MTSAEQWALLVGFLMPLLLSVIQQPGWSKPVRAIVMFIVCIVGGLITVWVATPGGLSGSSTHGIIGVCLTVALAAVAFYEKFWKPTGVAPAIEAATSPGGSATPAPGGG